MPSVLPNVLVVVSDALRQDHLACYGSRWTSTPAVDALAARGLVFEQAVSAAAWTAPSTMSLVTGRLPHRHGYLSWHQDPDPAVETVFDRFAAAGYEVGSFVFDDGFLFRGLASARVRGEANDPAAARDWVANAPEPFFAYVHSWATHLPRHVPHGERDRWREAKQGLLDRIRSDSAREYQAIREEYSRAVEWMSEHVLGSLVATVEARGAGERTVVAFLSDHGESWGERLPDKQDVGGIYHLHGATLHDEVVLVPLILAGPGVEDGRAAESVSTVDLAPTLLELSGLPALDCDGRSLLRDRRAADEPVVTATTDRGRISQLAVRTPAWKLIRHLETDIEEGYRLDVDRRELVDRAGEAPEQLRFLLARECDDVDRSELSAEEEATVVARLSDLGYL